jgi:hypothetical protein
LGSTHRNHPLSRAAPGFSALGDAPLELWKDHREVVWRELDILAVGYEWPDAPQDNLTPWQGVAEVFWNGDSPDSVRQRYPRPTLRVAGMASFFRNAYHLDHALVLPEPLEHIGRFASRELAQDWERSDDERARGRILRYRDAHGEEIQGDFLWASGSIFAAFQLSLLPLLRVIVSSDRGVQLANSHDDFVPPYAAQYDDRVDNLLVGAVLSGERATVRFAFDAFGPAWNQDNKARPFEARWVTGALGAAAARNADDALIAALLQGTEGGGQRQYYWDDYHSDSPTDFYESFFWHVPRAAAAATIRAARTRAFFWSRAEERADESHALLDDSQVLRYLFNDIRETSTSHMATKYRHQPMQLGWRALLDIYMDFGAAEIAAGQEELLQFAGGLPGTFSAALFASSRTNEERGEVFLAWRRRLPSYEAMGLEEDEWQESFQEESSLRSGMGVALYVLMGFLRGGALRDLTEMLHAFPDALRSTWSHFSTREYWEEASQTMDELVDTVSAFVHGGPYEHNETLALDILRVLDRHGAVLKRGFFDKLYVYTSARVRAFIVENMVKNDRTADVLEAFLRQGALYDRSDAMQATFMAFLVRAHELRPDDLHAALKAVALKDAVALSLMASDPLRDALNAPSVHNALDAPALGLLLGAAYNIARADAMESAREFGAWYQSALDASARASLWRESFEMALSVGIGRDSLANVRYVLELLGIPAGRRGAKRKRGGAPSNALASLHLSDDAGVSGDVNDDGGVDWEALVYAERAPAELL